MAKQLIINTLLFAFLHHIILVVHLIIVNLHFLRRIITDE